ncbi:MAG: hypothetical protein Q7O66_17535, partial [Dehalococcoidia bacterium]|nr:hypothetical protein [Dehalococcoidia bacterium]
GFGDPLERDPARVLADVIDEVVSLGEALASYGVVIDATTCRLDMERTAAIRRSRRSERATQAASSASHSPV